MKMFWVHTAWDVFFTVWMSVLVFHYAHWSVALVLTLLLSRAALEDALERLKKLLTSRVA